MPSSVPSPRSYAVLLLAVVLAMSSVLAGCSGVEGAGQKPPAASGEGAAGAQAGDDSAPKPPTTWPLTGLRVKGKARSAAKKHPVMVLKMDNTYSSEPQVGLGRADMVVEELVEGGLTRLAAFFYTRIPGTVGPVRSMRASDIGIVKPVRASMVTSGAASVTIRRIQGAGIRYFNEASKGFFRDNNRVAPYNLFTDLRRTTGLIKQDQAGRPRNYLQWGKAADLPQGQQARSLDATFSGGHTTGWAYRKGRYVDQNSYAAKGDRFPATTILVLRVREGNAGYLDPAGNPVPEVKLTGTGPALLFHGGRLVRGEWSKESVRGRIKLMHKGKRLNVPAGRTWIELVPRDRSGGGIRYSK